MTDTSWLEVDLVGLRRNIQAWRGLLRKPRASGAAPAKLCAVVKADAYGLGAGEIGRCLDQAGVDMLAVYSPGQADELLQHPITRPILLLMPVRTRPETVRLQNAMFNGQLHLTVDAPDQLMAVHAIGASYGVEVPIHLSLDTGMSRGGLSLDQFTAILRRLPRLRHVRLAGIWTHFAAAETDPAFTEQQFTLFTEAIELNRKRIPRGVILHAAATHAALRDPRYHLNMARIGLGMFGYGSTEPHIDCSPDVPASTPDACASASLRPVIRWRSRLIHVRRYPAGATVGYNCTTRLSRDSFLGLVPVGYADGLPLSLSGTGAVNVIPRTAMRDGKFQSSAGAVAAPIIGRVNMDQIIIDLTPGIGRGGQPERGTAGSSTAPLAQVGDLVDVLSPDPLAPCSLPNLARLAGTSCYELLCRISPRVPRLYANAAPSPAVVAGERLKLAVG